MATVLIADELGAGRSRLVEILPWVRRLRAVGWRVVCVVRDLEAAERLLTPLEIPFLQAPLRATPPLEAVAALSSYADFLSNYGFADEDELAGRVRVWRRLFKAIKPELLVCRHSPTALLASRGLGMRRVAVGNGFTLPAAVSPLPHITSLRLAERGEATREEAVLGAVNAVLERMEEAPLESLGALFVTDREVVCDFEALDPYRESRRGAQWLGYASEEEGAEVVWPVGEGAAVYVASAWFPAFPALIEALKSHRCRVSIHAPGLAEPVRRRLGGDSVRFLEREPSPAALSEGCDLAVVNGSHGEVARLLMAGIPLLVLPLALEQYALGESVVKLGAGACAPLLRPKGIAGKLAYLLGEPSASEAARRFASDHPAITAEAHAERVVEAILRPVSGPVLH